MIETTQLGCKLVEILQKPEMVSENCVIEFKREPHCKDKDCELFKDVLGLANAYFRPNEDRWLIYGVDDETHELIGIPRNHVDLLDDSCYQQKFKKIYPVLHIELVKVPANCVREGFGDDVTFAAFYIPQENFGHIYELNETIRDKKDARGEFRKLQEGMSFVRIGSSTHPLREEDRCKIRKLADTLIVRPAKQFDKYYGANGQDGIMTDEFDNLVLTGSWDEGNENDIAFISGLCGKPYPSIIRDLRDALDAGFFDVRGTKWTVSSRKERLMAIGKHLTGTALRSLAEPFAEALSTVDGKYEVPGDKRILVNVTGVDRGASADLREGIASLCAMLSNERSLVPMCSDTDISFFICRITESIVGANDWRVLASSENILPFLAEASPQIFLSCVEDSLLKTEAIPQFLSEKSGGIASIDLGWGLFRGIQIAAIPSESFPRALNVLHSLMPYSSSAENAVVDTLLPWMPSTEASVKTRIGVGRFLSENDENAWNVILKLLPGVTTSKINSVEPTYMKARDIEEPPAVSEYWEVSRSYCKSALDGARGDANRILDVIANANSFKSAGLIDVMCGMVREEASELSEWEKYRIWSSARSLIDHYEQYDGPIWDVSEEDMTELRKLVEEIAPANSYFVALRLFSLSEWELTNSRNDREAEHARVAKLRSEVLCALYNDCGISVVEQLVRDGAKGRAIGDALTRFRITDNDEQMVLSLLDNEKCEDIELREIAKNYAWMKVVHEGLDWTNAVKVCNWPKSRIAQLYASLPITRDVWVKAEGALGENTPLFWKAVPADRLFDSSADIETFASRMLAVDRADEILGTLEHGIEQALALDPSLVSKALENIRMKELGSMHSYYIGKLLEYLEMTSPGDSLFVLEFRYSPAVTDRSDAYIYKRMSEDPYAFIEVASIAFGRPLGAEEDGFRVNDTTRFAVYGRIMAQWIITPGTNELGEFEADAFDKWINAVESKAEDERELSFVRYLIGRNLFHASPVDEFIMPAPIAEYLESSDDALGGYSDESINSRGVHFVDPTGKPEDDLADAYTEKAEAAETKGYMKLASSLRGIARFYRAEAEENRRGHN